MSVHLHRSVQHRLAWCLALLCACPGARAQAVQQAETPTAPDSVRIDQVPRVPGTGALLRGLNAGVTFSGVHDSSIGWYTNGLGHDNGVTTSVGIPLTANLTLSGYYNRSFTQSLDTVSTGITYVLRGRQGIKKLSMIDRALREAEGANRQAH